MVVYADTSFLFSLYAQDAHTARANELARSMSGLLIVTPLQGFELRNALRLSVFRGALAPDECGRLLALIDGDLHAGALVDTPVAWADVFAGAEALSAAHTAVLGIRAADLLHVATALALGAKTFYTFDDRQKALAVHAGMKVRS